LTDTANNFQAANF